MQFQIKIKDLRDHYYDLTNEAEREMLYRDLDCLEDPFCYTVVDLKTDRNWANFDENTNVDDVIEIITYLEILKDNQYEAFIKEILKREEAPIDIIRNIKNESWN